MTTPEGNNTHGGYEGSQSRSEPKEPPMTKTQDELLKLARGLADDLEQGHWSMADAVTMIRALSDRLAALRSPDPEVERLRAALQFYADEPAHEFPSDGPWGVNSDDFGRVARAALSSNSGGR